MTWEDDFMCVTQSVFSEMRLLVEGAIVVYEDDAGVLCNLARDAKKYDALRALNDVGTALYEFRRHLKKLQEAHRKEELRLSEEQA